MRLLTVLLQKKLVTSNFSFPWNVFMSISKLNYFNFLTTISSYISKVGDLMFMDNFYYRRCKGVYRFRRRQKNLRTVCTFLDPYYRSAKDFIKKKPRRVKWCLKIITYSNREKNSMLAFPTKQAELPRDFTINTLF